MDYKYIEQLLDMYWQCKTTLEEERILRSFFSQSQLPSHLEKYAPIFRSQQDFCEKGLSAEFDWHILHLIEGNVVKARPNTHRMRLAPLYRAAAIVAIVCSLALAAHHSFQSHQKEPVVSYNYSGYHDTYDDPQLALEQVSSALKTVSEGLRLSGIGLSDSIQQKIKE